MEASSPRRVDAARNDERILAGALAALGRDPSAGMNAIAAACGVSRATLFRRYPTREALIETLRADAHRDLRASLDAAQTERGDAREALRRACEALLSVGEQYGFLEQNPNVPGRHVGVTQIAEQLETLIARGQDGGEFTPSLPPRWATGLIVSVLMLATEEAQTSTHAAALELMVRTLERALASP